MEIKFIYPMQLFIVNYIGISLFQQTSLLNHVLSTRDFPLLPSCRMGNLS